MGIGEIAISGAPVYYQKYLKRGDDQGNGNNTIDKRKEAATAAYGFCSENQFDCNQFLQYLADSGYSIPTPKITVEDRTIGIYTRYLTGRGVDAEARKGWLRNMQFLLESESSQKFKVKLVDLLFSIPDDGDKYIRIGVIQNLQKIALLNISSQLRERIVTFIIGAMSDNEVEVRHAAIESLRWIVGLNASIKLEMRIVEPFINALKDEDGGVRDDAREGLINLASVRELSLGPRRKLREKIADLLIKTLADKQNVEARREASHMLAYLTSDDIKQPILARMADLLIDALSGDEDNTVKANAARALGNLISSRIDPRLKMKMIEPLMTALENRDSTVGVASANALINFTGLRYIPRELKDKIREKIIDFYLRVFAGEGGDQLLTSNNAYTNLLELALSDDISPELKAKMVRPLIARLGNEEPELQRRAAEILGILATRTGIPIELKVEMVEPLINLLRSSTDEYVKNDATAALARLAIQDFPLQVKIKLIDPLIEAVWNETRYLFLNATTALVDIIQSDIVPLEFKNRIIDSMAKELENEERQINAAYTLANIVEANISFELKEKIINLLVGCLRHEKSRVRQIAAAAFEYSTTLPEELKAKVISSLFDALADGERLVRYGALFALRSFAESEATVEKSKIPPEHFAEVKDLFFYADSDVLVFRYFITKEDIDGCSVPDQVKIILRQALDISRETRIKIAEKAAPLLIGVVAEGEDDIKKLSLSLLSADCSAKEAARAAILDLAGLKDLPPSLKMLIQEAIQIYQIQRREPNCF